MDGTSKLVAPLAEFHSRIYLTLSPLVEQPIPVLPLYVSANPPSPLASAGHVLYHHAFDLPRFELTPYTTYDAYVYAVNSNRVDSLNLLAPEFPLISLLSVHTSQSQGSFQLSWKGTFVERLSRIHVRDRGDGCPRNPFTQGYLVV
jgi:hypothetical protein